MDGDRAHRHQQQSQRQQPHSERPQTKVSQNSQSQNQQPRYNNAAPTAAASSSTLLMPGQHSSPPLASPAKPGPQTFTPNSPDNPRSKTIDADILKILRPYGMKAEHIKDIERYIAGRQRVLSILDNYEMKAEDKKEIERYLQGSDQNEGEIQQLRSNLRM